MKQDPTLSPAAATAAMRSVSLPDVCRVGHLSRMTGLSESAIRTLLRRGELPGRKVGRQWLISRDALIGWLTVRAVPAPEQRGTPRAPARALRVIRGEEPLPKLDGGGDDE